MAVRACWPAATCHISLYQLCVRKKEEINKDPAVPGFNGPKALCEITTGKNLTHHTINQEVPEIIFTLYSPLAGLIIAVDRCAPGLESITIHPWTMINGPLRTNSKWMLSSSVHGLIAVTKHLIIFARPCLALQKLDKKYKCVGARWCAFECTRETVLHADTTISISHPTCWHSLCPKSDQLFFQFYNKLQTYSVIAQ